MLDALEGADVLHLHREHANTWRALCEHLRLAPPDAQYPAVRDIGLRRHRASAARQANDRSCKAASARPVAVGSEAARGLGRNQRERIRAGRNRQLLCGCASKTILLKSSRRGGCCEMIPSPETSDFFVRLTSPRTGRRSLARGHRGATWRSESQRGRDLEPRQFPVRAFRSDAASHECSGPGDRFLSSP